jgi:hypothetical protein
VYNLLYQASITSTHDSSQAFESKYYAAKENISDFPDTPRDAQVGRRLLGWAAEPGDAFVVEADREERAGWGFF